MNKDKSSTIYAVDLDIVIILQKPSALPLDGLSFPIKTHSERFCCTVCTQQHPATFIRSSVHRLATLHLKVRGRYQSFFFSQSAQWLSVLQAMGLIHDRLMMDTLYCTTQRFYIEVSGRTSIIQAVLPTVNLFQTTFNLRSVTKLNCQNSTDGIGEAYHAPYV